MSAVAIDYRLLLVQPTTIFAARVNQTTFTSTAAQVTFDGVTTGAYTDIRTDMLILFGSTAGNDDYGRARVRKAATSNTLYFGWAARAKGEGEAYLVDDAYITVLDLYKPWTKNPRITDDGVQYLDYDRDYATYGHSAPVANLDCGPAVQADLDSETDLATFSFNATHTYMTDPDANAMYSAWLWELPAEAVVTAGATNSHAITFTLPVGAWWVSAYETASTGAIGTRRVLCVAGEPTGTLSEFDQLSIVRRAEGQTLRVRVSESIPEATYPNGCMAVLWKRQTSDGVEVTPSGLSGHEHICFAGWHYQDDTDGRATERGFIDSTTLEFRDAGGWLQLLPGYPITVKRDESPSTWFELKDANLDYYFARIMLEYSNIVTLTDWIWSGEGYSHYQFPVLASKGSTLYQQVDGRAQAIGFRLTCDQWGRLNITDDPQLEDNAGGSTPNARTATVQKALTEANWTDLTVRATPFPRTNWDWESAIVSKSVDADDLPQIDTVFCIAPGRAPSQGTSAAQTGEQLAETQAELNARAGHRYAAKMNNPTGAVEITLSGPDDFAIQPAYMTWITLTTSAATAGQRGRTYSADRFLPLEVSIDYDAAAGSQTVRILAEKEVYGTPAETYYPPRYDYGDYPVTDWGTLPVKPPPTAKYLLDEKVSRIILVHASGEISITSDFQTPEASGGPDYTVVDLSLDGTALDAAFDPYSPIYLGTGTTTNAWIVTTTRIYYVTDIGGVSSRSVSSQHTFAAESSARVIKTSEGVRNWCMVSSYYDTTGVKAAYTTDGGSTWTETQVGSGAPFQFAWEYSIDFTDSATEDLLENLLYSGSLSEQDDWEDGSGLGGYNSSVGGTPTEVISWKVRVPWDNEQIDGGQTIYPTFRYVQFTMDIDSVILADPGPEPDLQGCFFEYNAIPAESVEIADWKNEIAPQAPSVTFTWTGEVAREFSDYKQILVWYITNTGLAWDPDDRRLWVTSLTVKGTGDDPFAAINDSVPPSTQPTLYVSAKIPGLAYVGAGVNYTGGLYRTVDYGATWVKVTTPATTFGNSLGGAFHIPWHDNDDETVFYWSGIDTEKNTYRTEKNGSTITDITPAANLTPDAPHAIHASYTNRHVIAMAVNDLTGANVDVYFSNDAGDTWIQVVETKASASAYKGVYVANDDGFLLLWGPAGIGILAEPVENSVSAAIDDRTGDASTSEVLTIGGW